MPLIATGDPHLLCEAGLFGKEAELEKLSSNLDSERNVDTDLADPELMDPVPVIETISLVIYVIFSPTAYSKPKFPKTFLHHNQSWQLCASIF